MHSYLEIQDQSALQVQQGRGFSIAQLQLMETFHGDVQMVLLLMLTQQHVTHSCAATSPNV